MVTCYLALDMSRAIGKKVLMTGSTSSPLEEQTPWAASYVYKQKKANEGKHNPMRTPQYDLNMSHNWSVPYEQPHRWYSEQANSASSGSWWNPGQRHVYRTGIHKKVSSKTTLKNVPSHSSESNDHCGFHEYSWWKSQSYLCDFWDCLQVSS